MEKNKTIKLLPLEGDFVVECEVCAQHYQNWVGSTPCCGSLAFIVNDSPLKFNKPVKAVLEKNEIKN